MAIRYHIQELPDMRDGEQAQFPVYETYNQFDNKAMTDRIALESGIQKGAVLGTLSALPSALKNFLLEGHSCKIDGFGTFSLSLTFDKNKQVRVKGLNIKIATEFMQMLQKEAEFELSQSEVVRVSASKGHRDEHFALLDKWLDKHSQITLQEYANLTGVSTASASRELRYFCDNADYNLTSTGHSNRKFWTRRQR